MIMYFSNSAEPLVSSLSLKHYGTFCYNKSSELVLQWEW